MRQDQQTTQTFVMLAMALVTGTVAVGLYQHAGLPGPVAATTALAVYVVLLTIHALLWRGGHIQPVTEITAREPAAARSPNEEPKSGGAGLEAHKARRAPASPAEGIPPLTQRQAPREALPRMQSGPGRPAPSLSAPGAPKPAAPPPIPKAASVARPSGRGVQPELPLPQGEPDYWSYRPAAPKLELPPFVTGRVGNGRGQAPADGRGDESPATPPPLPTAAKGPREADVEAIQDAIKRLLEEVNAAEAQNARARVAEAAGLSQFEVAPAPPAKPSEQVGYSADALKMAADAMRAAGRKAEAVPPPLPNGTGSHLSDFSAFEAPRAREAGRAISPSQARADLLSEAIRAGRIDVRLEPILGLEDHQTRHYEVSVRLRDANGLPLDVDGTGPDLRGTGLLPLFDSVRVTRTAAVARRLEERGKSGSIFSRFNGESITDDRFLGDLADVLHQRASLAAQLVLSFSQSDVRGFAAAEWDSLADMRALGFRFALTDVTDLDMNFEALAEQGFVFVKLDANVLLKGLPAPNGPIPSSDVCRHFAKAGLTLVVEHIDNDDQLARIFGFGVLLGQGQLFGGPRPVRADVAASRTAAA